MQAPEPTESTLSVQWLGINAVRFRYKNRVVLLDPYVTRNPKAPSNPDYIRKHIPAADCIVISHSHWDHIADTPTLARLTRATVVGSETTANICRAYGIPDSQLVTLHAGDEYETPDFSIRFLPSRHVFTPAGQVPYAGTYRTPPKPLLRQQDYLEGGTFAPLFQFGRHTVLDLGSANYIAEALDGIQCDLLLLSIARMENTPDFLPRLLRLVTPGLVVPVHFDNFNKPLERGLVVQPYCTPKAFMQSMRQLAPDTPARLLNLMETIRLP